MKIKFTNKRIKDLPTPDERAEWHYDSDLPGFAITVSPKGKKSWYFVGRLNGRKIRHKLGTFPVMTEDDARADALARAADVAHGIDIRRRERQGKLRVCDLWDHWLTHHAKPTKRTWEDDVRDYDRFIKPVLHHLLLTDVTRSDVDKIITNTEAEFGKGPANKARAIISAMFNHAIANEWATKNPAKGTRRPQYDPRQRYLTADEIKRWFEAIEQLQSEQARDYFLMLLWTGARRDNVASMEWDEIDLSRGIWVIPATKYKGKKPHVVPLTQNAVEIITRRAESKRDGARYVFPGRGQKGYYSDPKDAWKRVLELANIKDLRIHDLRRSVGAWQQAGGASLRTTQVTLGHSNPSVTAAFYSPVEVEGIRASLQETQERMRGE